MSFDLYIFDLDGTLIDTRQDLTTAVNEMLNQYGLESRSIDEVTGFVGDGIKKLVQRCIEKNCIEKSCTGKNFIYKSFIEKSRIKERCNEKNSIEKNLTEKSVVVLDEAVSIFKGSYWNHMLDTTKTYPGVMELLAHLKDTQKAILSNKAYRFTKEITDRLGLTGLFSVIVGGDTVSRKKPSTEGVEYILQKTGKSPERTVMVGDGRGDMDVARSAGLTSVYVTYGYSKIDKLAGIVPDFVIDSPEELLKIS